MTFYLSGSATYGLFLIYRMFQDPECSKTDFASWMVILIASLFWVIVIPVSIVEIRSKAKSERELSNLEDEDRPITSRQLIDDTL